MKKLILNFRHERHKQKLCSEQLEQLDGLQIPWLQQKSYNYTRVKVHLISNERIRRKKFWEMKLCLFYSTQFRTGHLICIDLQISQLFMLLPRRIILKTLNFGVVKYHFRLLIIQVCKQVKYNSLHQIVTKTKWPKIA